MRSARRCARSGTAALEFALTAPILIFLVFACLEGGRLFWTWQALQLASDQTARCVAIGSSLCPNPSSYAISTFNALGVQGLVAANVVVDNKPQTITDASVCSPPAGNTQLRVRLTLSFTSVAASLIPPLNQVLTTTSCYPLTGN